MIHQRRRFRDERKKIIHDDERQRTETMKIYRTFEKTLKSENKR